uniref:Uncharacterized protein n=1 Tax=Macaca mulatta TaxID=9544 RepID=A0A5F8AGV1_MACMU
QAQIYSSSCVGHVWVLVSCAHTNTQGRTSCSALDSRVVVPQEGVSLCHHIHGTWNETNWSPWQEHSTHFPVFNPPLPQRHFVQSPDRHGNTGGSHLRLEHPSSPRSSQSLTQPRVNCLTGVPSCFRKILLGPDIHSRPVSPLQTQISTPGPYLHPSMTAEPVPATQEAETETLQIYSLNIFDLYQLSRSAEKTGIAPGAVQEVFRVF